MIETKKTMIEEPDPKYTATFSRDDTSPIGSPLYFHMYGDNEDDIKKWARELRLPGELFIATVSGGKVERFVF